MMMMMEGKGRRGKGRRRKGGERIEEKGERLTVIG